MKNSIFVIEPYSWEGLWVFDDPNPGLVKEPFVEIKPASSPAHNVDS